MLTATILGKAPVESKLHPPIEQYYYSESSALENISTKIIDRLGKSTKMMG
jgi:hypothetical protein